MRGDGVAKLNKRGQWTVYFYDREVRKWREKSPGTYYGKPPGEVTEAEARRFLKTLRHKIIPTVGIAQELRPELDHIKNELTAILAVLERIARRLEDPAALESLKRHPEEPRR